jgi:DNA-binding MarR family transcriptional regulator
MDDEILKLDNQLCFRLYYISRKMTKAYQPLLKKYDLTYPQYIVMLAMFEEKRVDFKVLSQRVNLAEGTLTPIIKRLEKMGYVKKEKNEDDQRKIDVVLTKKGDQLNEKIIDVPMGLAKRLQLSLERYQSVVHELEELDKLLDQHLDDDSNERELT